MQKAFVLVEVDSYLHIPSPLQSKLEAAELEKQNPVTYQSQ
jgi:hypothetical protein